MFVRHPEYGAHFPIMPPYYSGVWIRRVAGAIGGRHEPIRKVTGAAICRIWSKCGSISVAFLEGKGARDTNDPMLKDKTERSPFDMDAPFLP